MSSILPTKKSSGHCIGFRLDDANHQLLVQRAGQLNQSTHQVARIYLLQILQEQQERTALHEAMAELFQQNVRLRRDLRVAVEALLSSAGRAEPTDAHDWVQEHLK
jgi:hypothetical protein